MLSCSKSLNLGHKDLEDVWRSNPSAVGASPDTVISHQQLSSLSPAHQQPKRRFLNRIRSEIDPPKSSVLRRKWRQQLADKNRADETNLGELASEDNGANEESPVEESPAKALDSPALLSGRHQTEYEAENDAKEGNSIAAVAAAALYDEGEDVDELPEGRSKGTFKF